MTITITGNKGEFTYNIVTDGEKCFIVAQDKDGIKTMQGTISINGDGNSTIKTKITETTEKYDKEGKLVEKITMEKLWKGDTVYKSGSVIFPQEPTKSCCQCKCELNAEDIIKAVHDYTKRTGKSPFLI